MCLYIIYSRNKSWIFGKVGLAQIKNNTVYHKTVGISEYLVADFTVSGNENDASCGCGVITYWEIYDSLSKSIGPWSHIWILSLLSKKRTDGH